MIRPFTLINKLKQTYVNKPRFLTNDVKIGRNVHFGRNVQFNCKKVKIGDGVIFKDNILINSDIFEIGDYGTIYNYCFFPGPGILKIGHNFWLGTASIIDCQGTTQIGNNVGIGAHSQLWTHIKFGDVMYGCRFNSVKPLIIEDDVWLVGHCLVSPVKIGARSLAMLGSLITKDMEPDRTYAGNPAGDVTERLGSQFRNTSIDDRKSYLKKRIYKFAEQNNIKDIKKFAEITTSQDQKPYDKANVSIFNVADRTYTKLGTNIEYKLMRYLLPDAKFIPHK